MKYFKTFKLINKPIINQNKLSNKSFLVIDRERIVPAFFMSILSSIIAKKKKFKPIIAGDFYKKNKVYYEIFKSFGFKNFKNIYSKNCIFLNPIITFKSIRYFIYAIFFLKTKGSSWFINNYKIYQILIGDLIFDTFNQVNPESIQDLRINLNKLKIIFIAIFRTIKILNLIKKNNVKIIVVPTQTYCYNSGIACRIGLTSKIKVLTIHDNNYLETHTFKSIIFGPYNILNNNLLNEVKKIKNSSKIERYLKNRRNLKAKTYYTGINDLKRANKFKNIHFSKKNFIKKFFKKDNSKNKKIVLIACHAFSDASKGLGTSLIFNDYYEWILETLKFIRSFKNNNILFIVKNHPSSTFNDLLIIKDLLKKYNNKNIILCPKRVNTNNLIEICDNVITARGTIGIEFATNGKFPIICGSAAYSGLGITLESASKKKYFQLLKKLDNLPKMSKNKILFARRVFYFMEHYQFNRLPKLNEKKLVLNKKIISNSKFSNQYNIFCKELIKNIKNIGFEHDDFYKYLLNIV